MKQVTTISVPRIVWSEEQQSNVEVVRMGHFPDTVYVRLPDQREIEVPLSSLSVPETKR